jgi:hypothetical protein
VRFIVAALLVVVASADVGADPKPGAGSGSSTPPPTPGCAYVTVGPVDFIVGAATTSTLVLRASSADCAGELTKAAQLSLTNVAGAALKADAAILSLADKTVKLTLRRVPKLEAGTAEWHLHPAASIATDLGVFTVETIAIDIKEVIVAYDDVRLETKQVGFAARTGAHGAIAVARPFDVRAGSSEESARVRIANTAQIDAPPGVIHPGAQYRWRIAYSTWGKSVQFHCHDADFRELPGSIGHADTDKDCEVNLGRIRYRVMRRLKTPLVATLELVEEPAVTAKAPGDVVVSSVDVTLAAEARLESLPLPLTSVLSVACQAHRWWIADPISVAERGNSIAIDDDAFEHKRCNLVVEYRKLATTNPNLARYLDVYGNQALEVAVSRGKKKTTFTMVVSPTEPPIDEPLSAPTGASDEIGPYLVTVRLVSGVKDVNYREGSLPAVSVNDEISDPQLTFDATLRPRGSRGLTYPLRLYATFPVTPVTLRFPPRAADLHASSQSPVIQVDTLRAGAMFVIEPWDYDADRNAFRIPLSFQSGLSFLRFQDKPVQFSWLIGVSLDFPIVDKGYSETSIAIGVFYELGLEERWRDTNRGYVVTAGLDLFRAFKTNNKSEK